MAHLRPGRPRRVAPDAHAEPVTMNELRYGYFPRAFTWLRDGKGCEVQSIERCWTVTGNKPSLHFLAKCDTGSFELVQDVTSNTWTAILSEVKP